MTSNASTNAEEPLLSNRFLVKLTVTVALLAALTLGISIVGRRYGEQLALAGHTDDVTIHQIAIGEDVINLPANMIRFEQQRRSGRAELVDAYLAWPEMTGYQRSLAERFNRTQASASLVFLQFSQSVMTRDMSGRLDPIYSRLFTTGVEKGPAGLEIHRMKPDSGFGNETVLTGKRQDGTVYVVRCLLPEFGQPSGNADCQRDIHVGKDLTLLYRFSSQLLPQWAALDRAMVEFAAARIQIR